MVLIFRKKTGHETFANTLICKGENSRDDVRRLVECAKRNSNHWKRAWIDAAPNSLSLLVHRANRKPTHWADLLKEKIAENK